MITRMLAAWPVLAAVAVAVSGTAAVAQQTGTQAARSGWPDTLPSGIYASPDCQSPTEIWVVAAGQELYADADHFYLSGLTPESGPIIHGWRRYDGFFARAFPSGQIEYMTWVGEDGEEPGEEAWIDQLPPALSGLEDEDWVGLRHVPCDAVPLPFSLLHGEAANFLLALEPAMASCTAGAGDCVGSIFAAVDKHRDGRLVAAELSRFVRVLLHLGVASEDDPAADQSAAAQLASLAVAPLVATAVIASYDYDGDGGLTLDEVAGELAGAGRLALSGGGAGVSESVGAAMEQARRSLEQLVPLLETLE